MNTSTGSNSASKLRCLYFTFEGYDQVLCQNLVFLAIHGAEPTDRKILDRDASRDARIARIERSSAQEILANSDLCD
jgi:hypothetical protein